MSKKSRICEFIKIVFCPVIFWKISHLSLLPILQFHKKTQRLQFVCLLLYYFICSGAKSVQLRSIYQPDNIHVPGWQAFDAKRSNSVSGDGSWVGSVCLACFQVIISTQ